MSILSVRSGREHVTSLPSADRSHHIFLPYFGGADGRVAMRLLLQLAENADITATVVHYPIPSDDSLEDSNITHQTEVPKGARSNLERTFSTEDDTAFFATLQRSLAPGIEARVV